MLKKLAHLLAATTLIVSPVTAAHAAPSASAILADAARYTVKILTLNQIGMNQDDGGSSTGTGFLIDRERGWILTNAHVATRSPSTIHIAFKGGPEVTAKRIHVDTLMDVAILEIDPKAVPATAINAKLDCGTLPAAGVSVMAYGHPWGLSFSASRGIVSGSAWFYPQELIQTDAKVNSGNSGGPLISLESGRVVGINTSTYKDENDENATAVSLAEPTGPICALVDLLRAGKDARLRLLPVSLAVSGDDLRPRVANSQIANSGFLPGDIISAVNGAGPIRSLYDLSARLRGLDRAKVTVERAGQKQEVLTTLRIIPDPLSARAVNVAGLTISAPWRLDDHEDNPAGNLVIDFVDIDSKAGDADISPSDTLIYVDGRRFTDLDALYQYLSSLPENQEVEFIVRGYSASSEFFREYNHIVLKRDKVEMISVKP